MKKASEYRQHAQDCRDLAAKMEFGDQREQLLRMAAHWEQLATDRLTLVRQHPEIARDEAEDEAVERDDQATAA